MSKVKVKIIPKQKRAKDRINSHGKFMSLLDVDFFRGDKSFFVESLDETFRVNKNLKTTWSGWFSFSEADFEIV